MNQPNTSHLRQTITSDNLGSIKKECKDLYHKLFLMSSNIKKFGYSNIPSELDENIEQTFTLKRQAVRLDLFEKLSDPKKAISMNEVILDSGPKI